MIMPRKLPDWAVVSESEEEEETEKNKKRKMSKSKSREEEDIEKNKKRKTSKGKDIEEGKKVKKAKMGHHSYDYSVRKSRDEELRSGEGSTMGYIKGALEEVERYEAEVAEANILSMLEEINKAKHVMKREAAEKQTEKKDNDEEEEEEEEEEEY